ncbi:hypothetical protein LTR35_005039 [Friedmanniomyces endolithicus]|uniref:Uncharacterized protein n=1 Tax=Friedmanniomyces endolithicus TaxID=329885 RepID=A0AAN6JG39_9PEZI|nr:hypothetical protein LTR35_005039 [Friedmanniomyces endolithicus]KAK0298826.1 hypothetical protein LTS00_002588 [Friedmanniomyces endolithicus]KAK0328817.1 hypothetical protein LTR82_000750 [Friedmanniomyces endolithicus]KAK1003955.1 hypothetical protein LTR54_007719 [Friedmanniomyces endolithicus]
MADLAEEEEEHQARLPINVPAELPYVVHLSLSDPFATLTTMAIILTRSSCIAASGPLPCSEESDGGGAVHVGEAGGESGDVFGIFAFARLHIHSLRV